MNEVSDGHGRAVLAAIGLLAAFAAPWVLAGPLTGPALIAAALLLTSASPVPAVRQLLERRFALEPGRVTHALVLVSFALVLFLLLVPLTLVIAGQEAVATGTMVDLLSVQLIFVAVTLAYFRVIDRGAERLRERLGHRRPDARRVLLCGLLWGVVLYLAMVLVAGAMVPASQRLADWLGYTASQEVSRLIPWLSERTVAEKGVIVMAAAVGEEMFFRGVLQPAIGIGPSSALFALAHVGHGSLPNVVGALLYSLGLGWLYRRYRSLLAPIAAHAFIDGIQLLVLLPLVGDRLPLGN